MKIIVVPKGFIRHHRDQMRRSIVPQTVAADTDSRAFALDELSRLPQFGEAEGRMELQDYLARGGANH